MEWYELLEVIRNTTERQELINLIPAVRALKEDVGYCTYSYLRSCLIEQFQLCGYRFSKNFNYSVI